MNATHRQNLDAHFARNTFGVSGAEFMWGLALPVLVESTFLQMFLAHHGASAQVLGLVPAIFSAGVALCSPGAALLTAHVRYKKRAVILTHMTSGVPMFAFGLLLLLVKGLPVVPLFIAAYILFAVGIGVTYPVWQNFLVSIFSPQKSVKGLAVMLITQIGARIVGSLLIMESVSRYAFSLRGASVMFMLTGVVFFAGAFFFMPVREIPDPEHEARSRHTACTMARAACEILRNRQFMLYMLSMSEMYATVTVIAFYAPYAVRYAAISAPHAAGLFMTCVYAGAITGNVLLGWFNLGSLRLKFMIGKITVLAAIGLMLAAHSLPAFLVTSFLLGIARSVAQLAQAPAVKLLSGKKDATDYFSIAPVFLLPFSFGLPWGSGRLLDLYAASGQLVWQLTFAGLAVVVLLSILALLAVDFNRAEVHVR